jgi:diguanylate cyclase (GGDEF)-like protein
MGRSETSGGPGAGKATEVHLLRNFAVLSAVPMVLLGLVLGQYLKTTIGHRSLTDARQTASILSGVAIKPQLQPSDLAEGLPADRIQALDRLFAKSGDLGSQVARVKIWNSAFTVVYSDDHSTIGRTFAAADDERDDALEGHIGSEISNLSNAENVDDRNYGSLLEVYVPLQFSSDAKVAGAFEIYLPYRPIAAAISADTNKMYGLLLGGLLLLYLVLFRIVAGAARRLRRQTAEHDYQALHDPLTNLPNRTSFQNQVDQAINAAKRTGSTVTVVLLDLDRFKEVNDTLGHHCGDLLLQELGSRLCAVLKGADTVARLGGDEFGVLVPSGPEPESSDGVAQRILSALKEPFTLQGLRLEVEASAGIVRFPDHGVESGGLLQRADVAMYVAKTRKTAFEIYSPGSDSYSPERLVLLGELRQAIAKDELVLHFQPVVNIASEDVTGVEALVRWVHPVQGLMGPDQFIPLAELTGLIDPLTSWVLDHALEQCRRWKDAGTDLCVSVNLSARNLHHDEFPAVAAELLSKWRLPASCLLLEITESAVMADAARAMAVLSQLKAMGISLAIDDFGTGYSSLAYLSRLPVASLKIDKSFVMNMADNDNDAVIVRSTIDLGRNLGLQVIAEGVETEGAWLELKALGCDLAQGYLISRGVPADDLSAWLADRIRTTALAKSI